MASRIGAFSALPRRVGRWPAFARLHPLFGGALAVAAGLYGAAAVDSGGRPGRAWSLGFGIAAATMLLLAVVYGIRRRTVRWHLGRTAVWLRLHVYGGVLFLLLVLMHTGFRVPAGAFHQWLWGLSLWITVSGLLGLLVQRWIPRVLTSGLSIEAHYHRIPELVADLRERARALADTCVEPVREFHRLRLAPVLAAPRPRLIYFVDVTGGGQARAKEFGYLARILSEEERRKLDDLELMVKTKLELDAHYTLQRALRWWLYLHVPFSLALVVLVAVHVYVGLTY